MFCVVTVTPSGRRRTWHMIRTADIRRVWSLANAEGFIVIATYLEM